MNSDVPWSWTALSQTIDPIWVFRYPHLPWSRLGLSKNQGITYKLLRLKMPNARGKWNRIYVSINMPMSDILAHLRYPWNKFGLSRNREITVELFRFLDKRNYEGNWNMISIGKYIKMPDIIKHGDMFEYLCINRNIELSTFPEHKRKYYSLSKFININEVINNPTLPWYRPCLSKNKDISVEIYNLCNKLNIGIGQWDWRSLTVFCDPQDIVNNPNLPWVKELLSIDLPHIEGKCDSRRIEVYPYTKLKRVYPFTLKEINWNYIPFVKTVTIPDLYALINKSIPFPPMSIVKTYYDIIIS